MQQIYMQSDEQFEVFTTVFSPQLCRTRVRMRSVEEDKVVAAINYRAHCPEELDLNHGDVIQVLFKKDHSWCFGRLQNGNEGYFPSACIATYGKAGESAKAPSSLLRRGSVPAVVMAAPDTPCAHPGKNSVRRALGHHGPAGTGGAALPASPSLLHRVLAKSRRKSCPHLPHRSPETGSINAAYLPE